MNATPGWFARCAAFLLPRVPLLVVGLLVVALALVVLLTLVPPLPVTP